MQLSKSQPASPGLRWIASVALALTIPLLLSAQELKQPPAKKTEEIVKAEVHLSVDKLPAGSKCEVLVRLNIQDGWHINTNPADPDYMKATEVEFQGKLGTKLSGLKFPKGAKLKLPDFDDPLMVYEKRVDLRGTLEVPEEAGGKTEEMEVVIKYQPCNDKACLAPKTIRTKGKLEVAKAGEPVKSVNEKYFSPPK